MLMFGQPKTTRISAKQPGSSKPNSQGEAKQS